MGIYILYLCNHIYSLSHLYFVFSRSRDHCYLTLVSRRTVLETCVIRSITNTSRNSLRNTQDSSLLLRCENPSLISSQIPLTFRVAASSERHISMSRLAFYSCSVTCVNSSKLKHKLLSNFAVKVS